MNEWMNEWMTARMNERINERMLNIYIPKSTVSTEIF